MATKRTLAATKRRGTEANGKAERPIPFQPVDAAIRRAAERSGIKPAKPRPAVKIDPTELERWDGLLARAQKEAINAAPRDLPRIGQGQPAAIRAYDTVGYVREGIARVVGGPS